MRDREPAGPEATEEDRFRDVRQFYEEVTQIVERMHRRYLDVIRLELQSLGIRDINAVQALILVSMRDEEMLIRDLIQRYYYLGSSTNYNIKKLVECGYLEQERARHDRRSVRIRLSAKGRDLVAELNQLQKQHAETLIEDGDLSQDIKSTRRWLRRVERVWAEFIELV